MMGSGLIGLVEVRSFSMPFTQMDYGCIVSNDHGEYRGVLFHIILIYDSYLKQVIHGHFVLDHVIVIVVGNTIRCNHDKV